MIENYLFPERNLMERITFRSRSFHLLCDTLRQLSDIMETQCSKFNVVSSFQNLKNFDFVYIFFYELFFFFVKQCFPFQTFPILLFMTSSFFDITPYFKYFFASLSLCPFLRIPSLKETESKLKVQMFVNSTFINNQRIHTQKLQTTWSFTFDTLTKAVFSTQFHNAINQHACNRDLSGATRYNNSEVS